MRPSLLFIVLLAVSTVCGSAAAQQKVQFAALDGKDGAAPTVLDGYLFRPDGPGPRPAVVFMHGRAGLFSRTTDAIVARETAWRQQLVAHQLQGVALSAATG
jgi:dipeptidyl aminopeptidase/acylaminoacyl peptidase